MWRSFWIVVAALIGASLGALAMVPGTYTELDGNRGCKVCGTYTTVLAGFTFREPYNAAGWAIVGAIVVGSAFALATRSLLSLMERRRTHRATVDASAARGRLD